MDTLSEVAIPDIGDFTDVPVIEILVAVGDAVAPEDPLVAIESDKATMEIPAPFAGIVREILLAVGDKVSEGTPIAMLESSGAAPQQARDASDDEHVEDASAGAQAPPAAAEPAAGGAAETVASASAPANG